jgi:hypothetical protein
MDRVTPQDYHLQPALTFRLHALARRERARAIARLFASLVARLAALRPLQVPSPRWG